MEGGSMRFRAKLTFASLTAALVLAALVGAASAGRLEISNTAIRVTWSGLQFTGTMGAITLNLTCPVTFEGSFHARTIVKSPESLIGYMTRAAVGGRFDCEGGGFQSMTILQERLPWHIRYEGFTGGLPNIGLIYIRVLRASIRIQNQLGNCLYEGTSASPARFAFNRNTGTSQIEGLFPPTANSIPLFESTEAFCPTTVVMAGTGAVRVLGSATSLIFVRLI
jgi:hypothetical protein